MGGNSCRDLPGVASRRAVLIAIDTNLLVYAHRPEMPLHAEARQWLNSLPERGEYFAIPWTCLHEFLAVVTNARIFREPTPLSTALEAVAALHDSDLFRVISESDRYLRYLGEVASAGRVSGAMIHDARIAAICLSNGIEHLWSADRDFTRFQRLRVSNPLLETDER